MENNSVEYLSSEEYVPLFEEVYIYLSVHSY